jgi:hypothetical protein
MAKINTVYAARPRCYRVPQGNTAANQANLMVGTQKELTGRVVQEGALSLLARRT